MFRSIKRLWETLTISQRRRVVLLTGAVVVMAILEVANVSAIAPFLALASDPGIIEENTILAFLYEFFGFDDVNRFLVAVGLGIFFLMVFSNAWAALTTWAKLRLIWSLNHQISMRLLERYLYRPYSYFLSRNTADLSKTLLSEVQQLTQQMIQPVILRLTGSGGASIVIVLIRARRGVYVTVVVGGSYASSTLYPQTSQCDRERPRQANQERFTVAAEALGGIKDVKVLNVEHSFLRRFAGPSRRYTRHQATSSVTATLPRHAIETVAFGTVVLIVVYFVALERDFSGIVPMLGMYAFAGYRLMPALQQIFHAVTAVRFFGSALEGVLNDLESDQEVAHPSDSESTQKAVLSVARPAIVEPMGLRQKLELKGIRFSYPNTDRPAVDGVSLEIPANAAVGFVGATGSGKTTLIDVILGLLKPEKGEIVVDGVVINDSNLKAWQRASDTSRSTFF